MRKNLLRPGRNAAAQGTHRGHLGRSLRAQPARTGLSPTRRTDRPRRHFHRFSGRRARLRNRHRSLREPPCATSAFHLAEVATSRTPILGQPARRVDPHGSGRDPCCAPTPKPTSGQDFEDSDRAHPARWQPWYAWREIAQVRDGFRDVDTASRFNGSPAAYVAVKSVGKQQVSGHRGKGQSSTSPPGPPPKASARTIWANSADDLRGRIDLLVRNGLMGSAARLPGPGSVPGPAPGLLDHHGHPHFVPRCAFLFITAMGGAINMISAVRFHLGAGHCGG